MRKGERAEPGGRHQENDGRTRQQPTRGWEAFSNVWVVLERAELLAVGGRHRVIVGRVMRRKGDSRATKLFRVSIDGFGLPRRVHSSHFVLYPFSPTWHSCCARDEKK